MFDSTSIEKEIYAVDYENQKNLQMDNWRINQLDRFTSFEGHPYSKFGTGNLNTLKIQPEKLDFNLRDALLEFHSKNYSSNLMTLCLLGNESLDELQQYTVKFFSEIPNKNLSIFKNTMNPYKIDASVDFFYVVPVDDKKIIFINWFVADYTRNYDSSPIKYVLHLFNNNSEGSLFFEIKKRGWWNFYKAECKLIAKDLQFFQISADLTIEGENNLSEMLILIFQYINMLKYEKPQKWIFDEINDMGKIDFENKNYVWPFQYVQTLSPLLHDILFADILRINSFTSIFNPNKIMQFLDFLTPETMKIFIISKKYQGQTDRNEFWYGTEYLQNKLNQSILFSLKICNRNSFFKLPKRNEFIPKNLSIINLKNLKTLPKYPRVIYSSNFERLWFKEDTIFRITDVFIKFEIRNPIVYSTPKNFTKTKLLFDLFDDSISELLHTALLAGLEKSSYPNKNGLFFQFYGQNENMNIFIEKVLESFINLRIKHNRFEILKEIVIFCFIQLS